MRALIYALFAWMLALSVLYAVQFAQINNSRAAARNDGRQLWRVVICTIETTTLKNPRLTTKQRTLAIKFWTDLLVDKVHTSACG